MTDLDERLREYGARWREHVPPPTLPALSQPRSFRWRWVALVSAACAATLVMASLALTHGHSHEPGSTRSEQLLLQHLRSRFDAGDHVFSQRTLTECLPNVRFAVDGRPAVPLGAGVVIGAIESVAKGRAYAIDGPDSVDGTEVDYDSPSADWRTLDVTVKVQRAYGEVATHSKVEFAVITGSTFDADEAIEGLDAMGTVVVALQDAGNFSYDRALYSVGMFGGALGLVGADGTLSFPILRHDLPDFTKGASTLAELDSASKSPDREVVVRSR